MSFETEELTPYMAFQSESRGSHALRPPTAAEKQIIAKKYAGQSWTQVLTPGNIVAKEHHAALLIEQCDRAIQAGNVQGAEALITIITRSSEDKAAMLRARMAGLVEWPMQKTSVEAMPVDGILFQAEPEESTLHFAMEARLGRSSIPLADWHPTDQD